MSLIERLRQLSADMLSLDMDMKLPAGSIDPSEAADRIEELERQLASCRREALEEAAKIAADYALDAQQDSEYALACNDLVEAIRALSNSTPTDSGNKS